MLPKAVRTKQFGVPHEEYSPNAYVYSTESGEVSPASADTDYRRGVASTKVFHHATFERLGGGSVPITPITPWTVGDSTTSCDSPPQTSSPELVAQALSAHANMLIQHSAFLAEVSQQFGRLAQNSLEWEGWLRRTHSERSAVDDDAGPGPRKTEGTSSRLDRDRQDGSVVVDNPRDSGLRRAEEAWARAMKELNEVRDLMNQLSDAPQARQNDAVCVHCSPGHSLEPPSQTPPLPQNVFDTQSEGEASQSCHPGSDCSPTPLHPAGNPLTPEPERLSSSTSVHATQSHPPCDTDVKSSEESVSSEWVCAASMHSEKTNHPCEAQLVQTIRGQVEHQHQLDNSPSFTVDSDQKHSLTPVLEVNSLRLTISRNSTCTPLATHARSQTDTTFLTVNHSTYACQQPGAHRSTPNILSFHPIRDCTSSDDDTTVQQRSDHRRSLVIGTTSENPTIPGKVRPRREGSGTLLRSFSRRSRRWWKNIVE